MLRSPKTATSSLDSSSSLDAWNVAVLDQQDGCVEGVDEGEREVPRLDAVLDKDVQLPIRTRWREAVCPAEGKEEIDLRFGRPCLGTLVAEPLRVFLVRNMVSMNSAGPSERPTFPDDLEGATNNKLLVNRDPQAENLAGRWRLVGGSFWRS